MCRLFIQSTMNKVPDTNVQQTLFPALQDAVCNGSPCILKCISHLEACWNPTASVSGSVSRVSGGTQICISNKFPSSVREAGPG